MLPKLMLTSSVAGGRLPLPPPVASDPSCSAGGSSWAGAGAGEGAGEATSCVTSAAAALEGRDAGGRSKILEDEEL